MAYIAKEKSSGKRLNILDFDNPRTQLKKEKIECQLCGGDLIIKDGWIRKAHFAHQKSCTSDLQSHPESPEHLFFKEYLSKQLQNHFGEYSTAELHLEYPIPEAGRVADIAALFPNGWIVVHEVQLASITTEQLSERTKDYREAGADVVWWLGHSAATPANKQWSRATNGGCFLLDYNRANEFLAIDKVLRGATET